MKHAKYSPQQKMSDLIYQNHDVLMIMSRFGITLGFGEQTVAEVCSEQNIDCDTFLTITRFVCEASYIDGKYQAEQLINKSTNLSLAAIMQYLKSSHSYFLDFQLPLIGEKLATTIIHQSDNRLTSMIMRFFHDYEDAVREHMQKEEETIFHYTEHLLAHEPGAHGYRVDDFNSRHDDIVSSLTELKNILVKYLPEKGNAHRMNQLLFDIFHCENDILSHCHIEERLFLPGVKQLECQLLGIDTPPFYIEKDITPCEEYEIDDNQPTLSTREKDIVCCIARGLSNKQIADNLCISIHTVITHRRNITQKLQIHSSAGLAIYAIVNELIDINEIDIE